MTAEPLGQDPAPSLPEGERMALPQGLCAIFVLRKPPPPPPEPEPWDPLAPPPWGPVGLPPDYRPADLREYPVDPSEQPR